MDNRGVTPVVEKLLTIGIVVLFIGSITTVLFGSAVPGYRDSVGSELGDRVVVSAAEQIEASVPPNGTATRGRTTIDVPRTIRGEPYALRVEGRTLTLVHPTRAVGGRVRLSLPDHVTDVSGSLRSQGNRTVTLLNTPRGVAVQLGDGE